MHFRIAALCGIVSLTACTAYLNEIRPTPNVLLSSVPQTIALTLAPEVPDAFSVTEDLSSVNLVVNRWRASLSNAFHDGFGRYFAATPPGAKPDLTLTIRRAELTLIYVGRGAARS
jgi:hypothetical protein